MIEPPRGLPEAPDENEADGHAANPAKTLVELRGIEPLTLRLPEGRKGKK